MHRARCVTYQAGLEEAIELTQLAYRSLSKGREPRLEIACQISLARFRGEAGEPVTALTALDSVRARSRPQSKEHAKLHWAQAVCHERLGYPERAVQDYLRARQILTGLAIHGDAALVGLDLGSTLISLDRPEEARVLALQALPVLATRGIYHYSLEALDLFRRAGGLS